MLPRLLGIVLILIALTGFGVALYLWKNRE
jgi:hypothetical protein